MIFSIDLVLYETLQFTCTNFDGCHTEKDNFFNLLQKEGGTHVDRLYQLKCILDDILYIWKTFY